MISGIGQGFSALRSFGSPDNTETVLFHPAEAAESSVIRRGIAYWDGLRGTRRFPAREEVTLRGLGSLARYTVLLRVLDGGRDFEFRFVGDVPASSVGANFQGRRVSEPEILAVMQANYRIRLYGEVLQSGEARVFKCRMLNDQGLRLPVHSESVFMPLGGEAVDHLLGFTVFCSDNCPG